jgi:hypothetical protein
MADDEQDAAENLDPESLPDYDDPTETIEEITARALGDRSSRSRTNRTGANDVGQIIGQLDADDISDDEAQAVAEAIDGDDDDLSPEEAAMHITAAPPDGEVGDGYLDD